MGDGGGGIKGFIAPQVMVLLHDERSPVFHCRSGEREKGLMPFLTGLLPEEVRASVCAITTQELVAAIKPLERHHDWIFEFERKYGMKRNTESHA